ncbi:DUF3426 domain-containing protein [Amphritea atlantica]|uniref:DUF3426 domain-containing protein n=1 Tax=Amphritea atlantica TaxID=355243 RepID=A0ABY5GSD8_9GAMM|nr:DUF3426 domain-containing protein [Amphritea atlantica]
MGRNIITECPACHTRFQVTQGQLKIASGKVRCGACLDVFNAEVYRCDDPNDLAEPQDRPLQQQLNTDQSHKDPLFDLIEIPDFSPPARPSEGIDKRYSIPDSEPEQTAQQNSDQYPRQQLPEQLPGLVTRQKIHLRQDDTDDRVPETESDAIHQASPQLPEQPLQPATESPDLNQPVSELLQPQHPGKAGFTDTDDLRPHSLPGKNTGLLLSDPEFDPELELKSKPALESESDTVSPTIPEAESHTGAPVADSDTKTPPETSVATVAIKLRPDSPPMRPATSLRAEPVMIRTTLEKSRSSAGWIVLSMLATLLLATQYLWFNRQHLSAYPELMPAYTLACEHLPCHLKTPIMLDLISTKKLVVLEHSQYQGVLSVNLLLENRRDADQPYPAILLAFSDRLGKLISERLFQPEDYLDAPESNNSGTTAPLKMPAGQTVQIHFDILDPGRRALSYEASLKAPATAKNKR